MHAKMNKKMSKNKNKTTILYIENEKMCFSVLATKYIYDIFIIYFNCFDEIQKSLQWLQLQVFFQLFCMLLWLLLWKQNIEHNQTYQNICTDQYTSSMQQRFIRILWNYVFFLPVFVLMEKEFWWFSNFSKINC